MRIMLDDGAFAPVRAHKEDAGLDIRAKCGAVVRAGQSMTFYTGVHVELPPGTAGLLVSKSGLNVRHDITSTGLIDPGYTGEIVIKLFNHGFEDYQVHAGDKISQLVVFPIWHDPVIKIVDELLETGRGDNGFGSSGR
ncbi:MAG: dUTP diphosphatase [Clostridia bacterium]|nr:dUTP diphosphatase [Clostridia bacterium]